ncbi:hypothetical protein AMAG_20075 [Allomyces macrogynus ATCC 38327]|uniref:Uncharacterized protein n=1 Tax=Allomyces macrogynus (strain ATCC 38327) TaxID=578462 RepID=A0A0L0T6S8_ALLM3|nr:hypothetical protein AMAG_20075 [Allomyces macrogynus ATCC 38327]|eukprot:KNE70284.1 hypothetical protein AMAG_20075 [Allomyces macrogynus ATCC 38327]
MARGVRCKGISGSVNNWGGAGPPPAHAGPGGIRDDAPGHVSERAPPPARRPGPACARDPAWQPAHPQVEPGTAAGASVGAADPTHAHTWAGPAWRPRAGPGLDTRHVASGRYAPAAEPDHVAAPHHRVLDTSGADLAPFTWRAAAVQGHPWWREQDGVDRHAVTWADPDPDPDPYSRYREQHRAATGRDHQQYLWHADQNLRLPHASAYDAARGRDPAVFGPNLAARDVPPPPPAFAVPSPPFSPPTAQRAVHATATHALDPLHDAPAGRFSTAVHGAWAYPGGESQPRPFATLAAPYDPGMPPEPWRDDRAHRDRPRYAAPYSPWSSGFHAVLDAAPTSPHALHVLSPWLGNDAVWARHDRTDRRAR